MVFWRMLSPAEQLLTISAGCSRTTALDRRSVQGKSSNDGGEGTTDEEAAHTEHRVACIVSRDGWKERLYNRQRQGQDHGVWHCNPTGERCVSALMRLLCSKAQGGPASSSQPVTAPYLSVISKAL